jgi:16S rRNA (cytosine967-C5)-methyltransferase
MKFYRPLLQGLLESLVLTLEENKVSTQVLEAVFKKNKKWGSKDRKAIAESFYEIIKWQLTLKKSLISADVQYAGKIDFIAVYYLASKGFRFEDFVGYSAEDIEILNQVLALASKNPFVSADFLNEKAGQDWSLNERFSFPEVLHQRLLKEGVNLLAFYKNSQIEAPLFVRANANQNTVLELKAKLADEGFKSEEDPTLPYGLKLSEKANLFKTQAFKEGCFEVQDGGSQMIAPYMDIKDVGFVIDACAGAGGKSLHLSNLMENKGRVLALDIYPWKLEELRKRARRNHCHNIETRLIEGTKTIKRLKDKADRLLLDVPCTGSGVFRRNPDAKYKWSEQAIQEIIELQKTILFSYASMVKPGGMMVYSTCSVLPSENQMQVQNFLNDNADWTLSDEQTISVGENNFDGYYMARLCRKL